MDLSNNNERKKILFITPTVTDTNFGGGKASRGRYLALKRHFHVDVYEIKKESSILSAVSVLQGHYPPMRNSTCSRIIEFCKNNQIDTLFFDTSAFGKAITYIKEELPNVKIIVHFNNCEFDYNNVRFNGENNIKSNIYKKLIYKNEYESLKNSDSKIVLSQRDKTRIAEVYGINADVILPLFLEDETNPEDFITTDKEGYVLVFGPAEKANLEGTRWFVKNVAPYIPYKTVVAGRGFDEYRNELSDSNVDILGYVDDIHDLYKNSICVCIPLFSGGGMKVKTIEAMMFGKTIFGTDEAFSGFDIAFDDVGGLCNSSKEYITEISNMQKSDKYNNKSRYIYETTYSSSSAESSFMNIINSL